MSIDSYFVRSGFRVTSGGAVSRFIRLSVVHGGRQVDVSVPSGRPTIEYLGELADILDVDPEGAWALSLPRCGVIEPEMTLDDVDLTDGALAYLTSVDDAAQAPTVTTVVDEIAEQVDVKYRFWQGISRADSMSVLSALVLIVSVLALSTDRSLLSTVAILFLAVLAAMAAAYVSSAKYWLGVIPVAGIAVGWSTTLGWPLADSVVVCAAAAGFSAAVAYAVRRRVGAAAALGCISLVALVVGIFIRLGMNATAFSAWSIPVYLLILSAVGRLIPTMTGLRQLVEENEGESEHVPIGTERIQARLQVSRDVLDYIVFGCCLGLSCSTVVLAATGVPLQVLLAAFVAPLAFLRSRSFTSTRHVAPLIATALVALWASFLWCVDHFGANQSAAFVIWVVVFALVVAWSALIFGAVELHDVAAARLTKLWNICDVLTLIAVMPVVFAAQGIYSYLVS